MSVRHTVTARTARSAQDEWRHTATVLASCGTSPGAAVTVNRFEGRCGRTVCVSTRDGSPLGSSHGISCRRQYRTVPSSRPQGILGVDGAPAGLLVTEGSPDGWLGGPGQRLSSFSLVVLRKEGRFSRAMLVVDFQTCVGCFRQAIG